jgi:hypothetical protein
MAAKLNPRVIYTFNKSFHRNFSSSSSLSETVAKLVPQYREQFKQIKANYGHKQLIDDR